MGGREQQDVPSETFCLTLPKYFVIEPFSVSLISAMEKFCFRGKSDDFRSKRFCLAVSKCFVVESIYVSESFGLRKI